jgi:transcriptional regulator with XRE-family HTH domain
VPEAHLLAFAARVKAERNERKLTQEQVADRSGLHLTYIAGIESGRRNPTLLSIVAIAAGLGVCPKDLLDGMEAKAK